MVVGIATYPDSVVERPSGTAQGGQSIGADEDVARKNSIARNHHLSG